MSTKNLYNQAAKDKIKELAEDIDFTMMLSNLKKIPFQVNPMSTKEVDSNGALWFLSGADSDHNRYIKRDGEVHLIYSKPGSMKFLSIYGKATITKERIRLEALYGKSDDLWFKGVDDPNLTALSVEPREAHYWDPKNNKLVTLFKMGVGVVTGEQPDISEEGSLSL